MFNHFLGVVAVKMISKVLSHEMRQECEEECGGISYGEGVNVGGERH